MEKDFARKLVKDVLEYNFERKRFVYLTRELLNHIEETPETIYRGNYIPDAYKEYIAALDRIGKYEDPDGKKLDVLVVQLKKETSLERARTMQRNFVAWYLNGSRGGVLKDAALVAFISPSEEDWRFSFVKMEYKLAETAKGIKAEEEFTPARRYSFLVGKNETTHTAQSRLVPILCEDERNPTLKELEDAFGIEKVTKEFFEKYRQLFLKLKESLDEIVKTDNKIKTDFEAKGIDIINFAKKLLGQVVFLYFLQKKGWFGVKSGQDWGTGSKHFLRELFEKRHSDYENFFNDVLEPLFYEALRRDRSDEDHYYSQFKCRIPFLNGGLFDPINDYDWVDTDILLTNELFSNNEETKQGDKGTGILDVFDRYNFTVKEDEPLEKEVAIDPEMLGKVFENLLEVKDRKSKGTYYTPREIVHYMCQQSLINYLASTVNIEKKPIASEKPVQKKFFGGPEHQQLSLRSDESAVSQEDVTSLILHGQSVLEHDKTVETKGKETKTYSYRMPLSIRENAAALDKALEFIRVCDPAVGSGAFLVGMMHEIVNARLVLSTYLNNSKNRTQYGFKRDAIQNCLYGVDIDPSAVEIAKLRLWLSLVVDEDDIKQIKPLPNLDYKIVCGNSLLGVAKNLYNEKLFNELERLKPLLFNETSPGKKRKYKDQIDEVISQITDGHKEFDFEVYFSEVFHEKKGFDIVIANPPYVAFQRMEVEAKKVLQNLKYKTFENTGDIYALFYERGQQLLKDKGILSYITSRQWMQASYGKSLRKFLATETNPIQLIDFGQAKIFEGATVFVNILLFEKNKNQNNQMACFIPNDYDVEHGNLTAFFAANKQKIAKLSENTWAVSNAQHINVQIEKIGKPLDKWKDIEFFRGITSGLNEAFHIEEPTKIDLINQDPKNVEIIKPLLRGKDIKRYGYNFENWYILNTHNGVRGVGLPRIDVIKDYPKIYDHLKQWQPQLEERLDKGEHWTNLRNCAFLLEFEKPKIVWIEISDRANYAYDDKGMYLTNSAYFLTCKGDKVSLKYLLAVFNSKVADFYFSQKTARIAGGRLRYTKQYVEQIPVPEISLDNQQPFITLVDRILVAKKENPQAEVKELEEQIDQMVYNLYGLTPDEIAIIQKP